MGGAVSDVIDTVGSIGQGAIDTVSNIGVSIDQTVRDTLPGGWTTAALLAAGAYYAPEIGAYITTAGETVPVGGAVTAPVTSGSVVATELPALGTTAAVGTGAALGTAAAGSTVPAAVTPAVTTPAVTETALGDMGATGTGGGTTSGGIGGATGAAQAQAAVDAAQGAGGLSSILSSAGGKMDLSSFSSILNIASGINSLTGGGISSALGIGPGSTPTATQAQTMADPFAPYRNTLAGWYAGALTPGAQTDVTQMPGYSQYKSGVLDPAMDASKRSAAASGQLYSGNESLALQKTGQQGYYGFMTDYLNRLAQGSGATQAPATAAGMGLTQGSSNQQAFSQGVGAVGQGISGLFGGGSPSSSYIGGSNMSGLFEGASNYSGGAGGYA
jgi:hypothetical protein